MKLKIKLRELNACRDAENWVGDRELSDVWAACERGDWMLWYAARAGCDRRKVVLAACACARLALQYVPPGEERPRLAIEAAEGWCRGAVEIEAVRTAADAATAAYAASYAASYAAAAAAAARYRTLSECASLVRKIISVQDMELL